MPRASTPLALPSLGMAMGLSKPSPVTKKLIGMAKLEYTFHFSSNNLLSCLKYLSSSCQNSFLYLPTIITSICYAT